MKKTKKKPELKLSDFVEAATKAGVRVSFGLVERMPRRFPDDPEPVKLLLDESERVTALANNWMHCKNPNPVAAEFAFRNGWAVAAAAAWLRCKLKGELKP